MPDKSKDAQRKEGWTNVGGAEGKQPNTEGERREESA